VIVVDTNVIAHLYVPTPFAAAAESQLQTDPGWTAPLLRRSEFWNILAGTLRRKLLGFEQASQLLAEAESLMAAGEHEVQSRHVLELVRDSDCSAYECEFVALALQLNV
jgi:predicted nucleic acid-binding protein